MADELMLESATLKQTVINILRSKHIQAVKFSYPYGYGTMKMNGQLYASLAGLVGNDSVRTFVNPAVGNGRGAEYDVAANRIVCKSDGFGQDPFEKGTIVHECTHAVFDMLKIKNVWWVHNEIVSYIAGALFDRSAQTAKYDAADRIWTTAGAIASKMQPGGEPDWHLVVKLYSAIVENSAYAEQAAADRIWEHTPNDGIW